MAATTETPTLDDGERATLAALGDVLIPEHGDLPSWSAADPAGKWTARALGARPEIVATVRRVLADAAGRDPDAEARRLHAEDREAFDALALAISGAYYMNVKVRRKIGYPGEKKNPFYPDEADWYLRDDILDPVIARGDHSPQVAPEPPRAVEDVSKPFNLPPAADDRCDVLIIGSGASGSVAARALAVAGYSVVCLEQGRWLNASEFPGSKPEFELHANGSYSADPNVRGWDADYPTQVAGSDIAPVMFNAVGGSTVHFCAQWARMRPADFRMRTLHGIGDDWPLSYEELVPYYHQVDGWFGISGVHGDPCYPGLQPPPQPGLPIGKIGRTAALGMNKLGWHWWPAHHDIPSQETENRPQCQRRGVCMWGCPEGAKGSADLTLWPTALKHGAKIITGARVREIATDDHGLATGAHWIDRDGVEHFQRASTVIVAGNGVGTPRLLLLSKSARHPDGLGNSSGLVGKRLMLHPYMSVLGIYEDPLDSWVGPWGTQLLSLQFADHDESRGFAGGAQWDVMPLGGPLFTLDRYPDLPFESRWGSSVHELMRRTLGHAFDWGIGIEDLPNEVNRVELDDALTDSNGIPAPRITFRIDDDQRRNLEFQLARAKEAHEAAGAIDTVVTDWSQWGWHLLGTCRMGDDPATSVVNRYGQSHDVPNLFVFDGSIFPTSGPQPPTATISALAARNAAALIRQAATLRTPA